MAWAAIERTGPAPDAKTRREFRFPDRRAAPEESLWGRGARWFWRLQPGRIVGGGRARWLSRPHPEGSPSSTEAAPARSRNRPDGDRRSHAAQSGIDRDAVR